MKSHRTSAEYVLGLIALGLGFLGWQYTAPWLTNYIGAFLGNVGGFLIGGVIVFLVIAIPPKRIKL